MDKIVLQKAIQTYIDWMQANQNFTYTLLNGIEDLAVIDWSKRTSTHAEVRLFLKKLTKLFFIEGIEESSMTGLLIGLQSTFLGLRHE